MRGLRNSGWKANVGIVFSIFLVFLSSVIFAGCGGKAAIEELLPPASLTALPGDREIVLTWQAATKASEYRVYVGTTSGGPYVEAGLTTATSYTVRDLINNTPYFITVASKSGDTVSAMSAEVRCVPKSAGDDTGNNWRVSTPEAQGMDAAKLLQIESCFPVYGSRLHSFLVIRHGYIVYEKYFNGFSVDRPNNIKSCTKSVTSLLTGIALDKKYLNSLEQTLYDFYPTYIQQEADQRKRTISLKHLLTMTSGFDWKEGQTALSWEASSNQNRFTISLPLKNNPGQVFNYSTGNTHLISGIITKVTGKSALQFAQEELFNYLGISNATWTVMNDGYNCGGSELYLVPRDMAKIGLLALRKGNWNGKQLVSEQWVTDATSRKIDTGWGNNDGYGYLWWMEEINGYEAFFAAGLGGQYIVVLPELDIIVVITQSWNSSDRFSTRFMPIAQYVIPSVK